MKKQLEKIKSYLLDSWLETKKVKWLTKKETVQLTIEVLAFSLTFAVIYGFLDFLFSRSIIFLLK